MHVPHKRTLLSLVATAGAMTGLVAAKGESHKPPPKTRVVVTGTGPRAVMTVTGPPIAVTHGIVQVRITVIADLIADVTATSLPHDNSDSWERSTIAARMLHDEVLKAQDARVDAISGATYTSKAYLVSLQAAIDAADIADP
jgi:uncharacterized protein with FMN-binding domain